MKPESALAQQGTAPAIFLSHSGKQKPFVERLHDALVAVNHVPFFDVVSLPIASPFPPRVKEAALGCQLGVVVLSHDFLTTKWPMLELGLFMNREPRPHILPLFYQLSPQDLKLEENLSKWRAAWSSNIASPEGSAGRNVDTDSWEKAVKSLAAFNGIVYVDGTSEREYIQKIVHHICKCIPNRALYNLPHIHGERRLAEEVARLFEGVKENNLFEGVKENNYAIGLYGVGGSGKTTISKIMANFYDSEYSGRSFVIEFPPDGDKGKIVVECKNALKNLANLTKEVLNKANDFDKVVELMKDHLKRCDVFIAIDNVWESCKDEAKRVLEAGFGAQSKVLLTSRSSDVLKELLGRNVCVMPVPTVDKKEAFQLLQEACGNDLDLSSVAQDRVDRVMGLCVFNEAYHPIALKSIGVRLKRRTLESGDAEKIGEAMSRVALNPKLSGIEGLIKRNFVDLPNDKQYMFLDIAFVLIRSLNMEDYRDVHQYLALLYEEQYRDKDDICDLIQQLALDGVLELEGVGEDRKVRVHNLYLELAQAEAEKSPRFLLSAGASSTTKSKCSAEVERVILGEGSTLELVLQEFPKLQVLIARGHNFLKGDLCLEHVPSLRVLDLDACPELGSIKAWSAAEKLAMVRLQHFESHHGVLGCISSTHRLQELVIENCGPWEGLPDLHGCDQLKKLILRYPKIQKSVFSKNNRKIAGNYLSSLGNLETLRIQGCEVEERKFPNLDSLGQLRSLEVWGCESLEEISGMDGLVNLQTLGLKKLPNLDALGQLRSLQVSSCESLEEISGMDGLVNLQTLRLYGCKSMKKLLNLDALGQLRSLQVSWCESLEEISGMDGLVNLQTLGLGGCNSLKKLPNLDALGQLRSLHVLWCESLEEISGMDGLVNLQALDLRYCGSLKKLGGLKGSEDLCVHLKECNALSMDESLLLCKLITW